MKADMTDVEPKTEQEEVLGNPVPSEPEPVVSESDSVGDREDGDGEEEIAAEKPLDDDLDRRNPQYIPKGGAFYEHDNRTVDTIENEETAEGDKKKKVWKESKTTERWLHDCYVEEEQAPKSEQELKDTYGYDIRNEENAPRARRRRKYGRGPDKYDRKWDDEQAYIGGQKPGRGRGGPRRRTGEDFPPLPKQNGENVDGEPPKEASRGRGVNTAWRNPQQSGAQSDRRSDLKDDRRGDKSEPRSDHRIDPRGDHRSDSRGDHRSEQRSDHRSEQRSDDRSEQRSERRSNPRSDHRGEPRSDLRSEHRNENRPSPRGSMLIRTVLNPQAHQNMTQKPQGQPRPRLEDNIKPFRNDGSSHRPQELTGDSHGKLAVANTAREIQDLSNSMAHMSMQQKHKAKDPRGKDLPQIQPKNQPVESPANRQNPKRYSSIRKGHGAYFPPEDCSPLDPREAEAAREMAVATTTPHNRAMAHLPQQRQQDILVQSVNVMQRYPDTYNGNPTFLPGRTILQSIPQPGLSPQGPIPQTLSPQLASIEMPPQPGFVPPPLFIDMGQGEVLPFQSFTTYPQGQSTEVYQTPSGITYYSPEIQTGAGQPRALPQRRKAAIPIVPPPETH